MYPETVDVVATRSAPDPAPQPVPTTTSTPNGVNTTTSNGTVRIIHPVTEDIIVVITESGPAPSPDRPCCCCNKKPQRAPETSILDVHPPVETGVPSDAKPPAYEPAPTSIPVEWSQAPVSSTLITVISSTSQPPLQEPETSSSTQIGDAPAIPISTADTTLKSESSISTASIATFSSSKASSHTQVDETASTQSASDAGTSEV